MTVRIVKPARKISTFHEISARHASDLAALQCSGLRPGISTHSLWKLACTLHLRSGYIACDPIYATGTKDMPWYPLGNHNK